MANHKTLTASACLAAGLFVLSGCTTAESVSKKAPSYVVQFGDVDRFKVADCADQRFIEKYNAGYFSVIKGGDPYAIEYWWRLRQPAPMFIAKFYADRVEINGRYNIWGDYGVEYSPIVEGCVIENGGNLIGQI